MVVVATAGSVFYAQHRDPGDYAAAQWRSFKHLTPDTGTSHFGSLGSNRYDFWRVALDEFVAHPLAGNGSRGFRAAYLESRRSSETPARAHSVELDALSETGIVGFVLLALALGLACASFAGRSRDDGVALGALGAFAIWLAQASVDWTWTFPAVGVPLFALRRHRGWRAGAPARASRGRRGSHSRSERSPSPSWCSVPPWLATRLRSTALAGGGNPQLAIDRARRLDPLSVRRCSHGGRSPRRPAAGIAPLTEAVRMEPRSADLLYALGRQQLLAGDKAAARRTLTRALRLDPADPTILTLLHTAG